MNFYEQVWEQTRKIPEGRVSTYKDIAESLSSRAYRALGTALNKNPYAPEVPCHRVVNSDGRVGNFASGTSKKVKILKKEGVSIKGGKVVNFDEIRCKF